MTYAEALDLLQLSPAEAADVRRIRDAYARRRTQLQNQLNAAAAAPLRAAYQETLAAVDMAAAMLQTRAKLPAPHSGTESGSPATSANGAGGEKPDWIAATPWHNIRNDAGEYQSAEPPAVPSRKPRAPKQSQKEAEPAATPPSMTMRLPDSALSEPPKVEELRPVATTLRSRPESPSDAVTLPHDESAGPSRWGTVMALLLAAGGLAGVAGWAWQAGLIDDLLGAGEVATAPRPSGEGADAAGSADSVTAADPAGARLDSDASEGSRDPETERQLATRIAEIERLGQELDRLAKELGGAATTDWREQLADAEKDRQTGAMDAAAEGMARLYDTLRTQTDAASRAVTSRQRLASAGPVEAESAIGKNVAAYLGSLRRQAELSVAEGNYASAAQKYDAAMDARLRLPRDIEQIEAARVAAATEHARAVEALARFELDADSSAAILGEPREELLAGSGSLIEAWLADERSAADLVQEYGEAALFFGDVADRLEQILEHQAVAESSRSERKTVEADIASMLVEPEKVLGANAAGKSAQDAEAALRGGQLDEALRGYKAAAGEEAELLEAAVRVRELAERRSAARKRISEERPRTVARFDQWEAQLRQRAEADGQPEGDSAWEAALTRLAADHRALEVIAAPISVDFSGDKAELEASAQEAELRVQTYEVVAAGLEQLISAEYRLMLLRQLAAGADVVVPEETEIALRRAAKAHADVEELAEGDLTRARLELAEQSMSEAVEQSDKAAIELSAPAAAKLSDMLIAAQKSYASQFGGIDLAGVWQPEELPAGVAPPAEFADEVAQGLAANADRDALQKELSSGSIDEAEAVLRHVRGLGVAEESLSRLRQLGSQKDEEGMSPLHHSAAAGQSREVRALLELRVDAAPRDSQGRTPLGLALSAGHLEVAKLLLESGGKPPAWLEGGRPIIFVAPASPEALKLLLAHGAPARDLHRGETALHALTWQANRGQIPAATQLEAARILLEAGVDPSALNRSSQTAAQLAASLGLPELARFLEKPKD